MSERPEAVAASGYYRKSKPDKKSLVIAGTVAAAGLAIAAFSACNSSEEIATTPSETPVSTQTIDCPEGVYGTPSNSVVVRSLGEEYDNDVLGVFEKYGACKDSVPEHLIELEGGVISVPFVLENSENVDNFLAELQPLVQKGKLVEVHLNTGLENN